MERVSILVEERVPVDLAAMRTQHQVHLIGHPHGRTERTGTLAFPLTGVEHDASAGGRIDAHLIHLAANRLLHVARRETLVVLACAEQRERVGTRRLTQLHAEHALHDGRCHVVPHGLRVAQERGAFVSERAERDTAQQLPGGIVAAREPDRLRDVALPLKPFLFQRRELALHECDARRLDHRPLSTVGAVRDLDGRAQVGNLATIREPDDRPAFPGDLALVERRELPAAP